jgi:hypothetical protein
VLVRPPLSQVPRNDIKRAHPMRRPLGRPLGRDPPAPPARGHLPAGRCGRGRAVLVPPLLLCTSRVLLSFWDYSPRAATQGCRKAQGTRRFRSLVTSARAVARGILYPLGALRTPKQHGVPPGACVSSLSIHFHGFSPLPPPPHKCTN